MHFNAGSVAFLGLVTFNSLASAQIQIAYGQELQANDQTNHWVAWEDGLEPCVGQAGERQVLGVLTKSPCDDTFSIGEVMFTFTGCSSTNGAPTAILDSGGLQVGVCSADSHTINCHKVKGHGEVHDIIKHGTCTVATAE
ncbi:hypothetical protein F5Y19DRAFT_470813 [Xylariaceae sp. FL1651]|nr:hypothetical protein F5Y19DRAFT_470813 [Xylariaceae sp. FL1651]